MKQVVDQTHTPPDPTQVSERFRIAQKEKEESMKERFEQVKKVMNSLPSRPKRAVELVMDKGHQPC